MSKICNPSCLYTVVSGGYEVVNGNLVLLKEGVDMLLVKKLGALCLRQYEVEEEEKSKPGIERDPLDTLVEALPTLVTEGLFYHTRMNPTHDSRSNAQASTTQYMSHGVNSAGSDVLRAL